MFFLKVNKKFVFQSNLPDSDTFLSDLNSSEKIIFQLPFIKSTSLKMTYCRTIKIEKRNNLTILNIGLKANVFKLLAIYFACFVFVCFLEFYTTNRILSSLILAPIFLGLFLQNIYRLNQILNSEIFHLMQIARKTT
jgi:hypothetical protein